MVYGVYELRFFLYNFKPYFLFCTCFDVSQTKKNKTKQNKTKHKKVKMEKERKKILGEK